MVSSRRSIFFHATRLRGISADRVTRLLYTDRCTGGRVLKLGIDRGLSDPVYEQVAGQLRRMVATGVLSPGTLLPSVRQLAGDLGVNLNTIARAYRLLEEEGFILIRGRVGAEVAAPAGRARRDAKLPLVEQLRATLARLKQTGVSHRELTRIVQREIRALGTEEESFDE
ncbi:MAG: GntR family transcriptional regulator [bacterium]|nr:GntR family transcriptional regulator [bacterium]